MQRKSFTLAIKQGKPDCSGRGLSPLTSPPSCKASRIPWGTHFENQDPSFYRKESNDLPKVTQQLGGTVELEASPDPTHVHSTSSFTWICHFNIHLPAAFQVPISEEGVKLQPSTGTHSLMSVTIVTVELGHRLWAGTSSGCTRCSIAILSLQQDSVSLSFLSRARFSAVPLPKSKQWQQPRMQCQQKGSHWPAKALCRDPTPSAPPHHACKHKPFFLGTRVPCASQHPLKASVTSPTLHWLHREPRAISICFCTFISMEGSISLCKRYVLLRTLMSLGLNLGLKVKRTQFHCIKKWNKFVLLCFVR